MLRPSLAGLMLAAVTGCNSSSSSPPASENQAASTPAPVPKKTPIVGSPEKGKELFAENCTTCHGLQGQGAPHLGADLQTSKFVASATDAKLLAFIEQGRSASDPLNTMHVAMPPKGGNPALTPQDLNDIVAFLRQIQKTHSEAK
jgi:mono/diheme cytochrome c family protein